MRIVAWDLETTDLKALMGRILCSSFYPIVDGVKTKPYTFRIDRKPWKSDDPIDDSALADAIRDELHKYNLIVTWNGKLFDLAFLNARLLKAGRARCTPQFHFDAMYQARGCQLRIGSSKLDNVQKFFDLAEEKTPITWENWNRAALGDKKAMADVVKHCEQDVEVLALAYWKLLPMVANLHR